MLADGPEIRRLTYRDLQRETAKVANALESLGVGQGDIVTIYMGMVPEVAIAMLACARIGAAHSVIFGGFSASAIVDRVNDAGSKVILTCDGSWRRGSVVPLKASVDEACRQLPRTSVVTPRRRQRDRDGRGTRPRLTRARGSAVRPPPLRTHGLRGAALPAVHLRFDREAEGHRARDRGILPPRLGDRTEHLQPPGRSGPGLLVHRRRRLDHRAQLHRLRRPAQSGADRHVRGRELRAGPFWSIVDRHKVRSSTPRRPPSVRS